MRLDVKVAQLSGKSRSAAADFIKRGLVRVNQQLILKPSYDISDESIELLIEKTYVSRGGEKLEGILPYLSLDLSTMHGLDVGASTGGFTECLLHYGIASMTCVDVGRDQLHASLKHDKRVDYHEGISILDFHSVINKTFDLIVMDVSFTSILNVFDALHQFTHPLSWLILLYKPQFEVGAKHLNKSGVVKNPKLTLQVQNNIIFSIKLKGYRLVHVIDSPLKGKEGNQETFLVFQRLEEI